MQNHIPLLTIIALVAISGLAGLLLDSNTGLAVVRPGALAPVSPCPGLGKQISSSLNDLQAYSCDLSYWLSIKSLVSCPGPKIGFIFSIGGDSKCEYVAEKILAATSKLQDLAAKDPNCNNILQAAREQVCSAKTLNLQDFCADIGDKFTSTLSTFQAQQCGQYYPISGLLECGGKKAGSIFINPQAPTVCNNVVNIAKDFSELEYIAAKEPACNNIVKSLQDQNCPVLALKPSGRTVRIPA